jgi:DNA (cytosine-5)-methyltransferase 1
VTTSLSFAQPHAAQTADQTVITTLDLFAGAGGLSTGLRQGDDRFTPVRAVELDPSAAATYALNHGGAVRSGRIVGDVVYAGDIESWLRDHEVPEVDVVVGGPPCQGFSTLGKQDEADDRNLLWHEYVDVVTRARPSFFVLENVPAFLASPQFEVFRAEFEPGGRLADYAFDARVLNAAEYGSAQVRRRVVAIGHHKDLPDPGFPTPTHAAKESQRTVRQALTRVAHEVANLPLPDRRVEFGGRELPGVYTSAELHVGRWYSDLSLERFRHVGEGENRFALPDHLKAPCWRRHTTGSGDVLGRLWWDRPSVTIRTEFYKPEKGRYLHPSQPRALTHLEAARLQGFPSRYRWVGSKVSIARQIGNAVPIPLGAALGAHLGAALRAAG